jgi:hypothetical protein
MTENPSTPKGKMMPTARGATTIAGGAVMKAVAARNAEHPS